MSDLPDDFHGLVPGRRQSQDALGQFPCRSSARRLGSIHAAARPELHTVLQLPGDPPHLKQWIAGKIAGAVAPGITLPSGERRGVAPLVAPGITLLSGDRRGVAPLVAPGITLESHC